MTIHKQTLWTTFTVLYLLIVLGTDISLVGYWTDVICSFILVSVGLWVVFRFKTEPTLQYETIRTFAVISSAIVFGIFGLNLINPFAWDAFKIKSFYYEKVDGRLFHAYFKPVGANGGGEGSFWITETPSYLPFIEIEKYYDRTVLWDFAASEWDGERVDQNEIVRKYIQNEIIN